MNAAQQAALDEELALEEEVALERARSSMLAFVLYVTPAFEVNFHHRLLCSLIDDMVAGRETRIIVSVPPQHGKSEILSRHLPAYLFGLNPDEKIVLCSYGMDLAERFNRDTQKIIDSDAYRRLFPDTQLSSPKNARHGGTTCVRTNKEFDIVGRKGNYRCAGAGGSALTGMPANWLLLDDLIADADEARSATVLDNKWEWYLSVARTRLSSTGRALLVGTRWADRDVAGRNIALAKSDPNADQWKVINLPAIKEGPPSHIDPRQPGEPLWPSRFPLKDLLTRKAIGGKTFQSLYQGDPVPPGGQLIKDIWWRRYKKGDLPQRFEKVIWSYDLAFTGNVGSAGAKGSDYCVGTLWGYTQGKAYMLDLARKQLSFTQQLQWVLRKYDATPYPVREVLVEKAANGDALVDTLYATIPNLIALPVGRHSKSARVESITPIIEAGHVYLPTQEECHWVADFELECSRFPSGTFDDCVDSLSQALSRLFPPRRNFATALPVGVAKAMMPNVHA